MMALTKLFDGIKKYLAKPKHRSVYAVIEGQYLGEFFVFMESRAGSHAFLSLPDMKLREMPVDSFKYALDCNILDRQRPLPRDTYEVCRAQYRKLTAEQ